jgi:ketosteroid isomerase-like protein
MSPGLLSDLEEIRALKARYGAAVDALCKRGAEAAAELIELFTADAVVDFNTLSGKVLRGHAEIAAHFTDVIGKPNGWMWHAFSNPVIEVNGDRASAVWLLYAMSTRREAVQVAPRVTYGRYHDEYARTPRGWRQSRLTFVNETRTGQNQAQGLA